MTQNRMLSGGFKLGTFSTNCSSGMTPTQAPERWVNSWDNNLKLAKLLDAAGIDFMLPIARWIAETHHGTLTLDDSGPSGSTFAARLPLTLKTRNGGSKYVLRQAVADLLPDELRNRKKKQFMSPSPEVLGLDDKNPLFHEYLTPRKVNEVGVFRPAALAALRKLLSLLPRGSYAYGLCEGVTIFSLSLHMLHEMFCKSFSTYTDRFALSARALELNPPMRMTHRAPTLQAASAGLPVDTR